jgi:hypothetical protein
MRSATIVLIGCACLLAVSPSELLAEGAVRIDELLEVTKAIEIEAAAWARSERPNIRVTHKLRTIWYNKGSLGPLKTVLETPRESPNDLFVVNRLLSPMLNAAAPVISESLAMIHPISERLAVYKPLATYTEKQLEAMAPAEDADKSLKVAASKRRAEKRKADVIVQKHNQQARAMRTVVFRRMVLARNREEDTVLLKALVQSEKNGDWMYADILEAIRKEARRMSKERAGVFYAALREWWNDLRAADGKGQKTYTDQGSVELLAESNSKFTTHQDITKNRVLTVINQVASSARMPALKDPKNKKPKKKTPTKKKKRGRPRT